MRHVDNENLLNPPDLDGIPRHEGYVSCFCCAGHAPPSGMGSRVVSMTSQAFVQPSAAWTWLKRHRWKSDLRQYAEVDKKEVPAGGGHPRGGRPGAKDADGTTSIPKNLGVFNCDLRLMGPERAGSPSACRTAVNTDRQYRKKPTRKRAMNVPYWHRHPQSIELRSVEQDVKTFRKGNFTSRNVIVRIRSTLGSTAPEIGRDCQALGDHFDNYVYLMRLYLRYN